MSAKICLTPGFIPFLSTMRVYLEDHENFETLLPVLRHTQSAVQCRRTTVRPHAWGCRVWWGHELRRTDLHKEKQNWAGEEEEKCRESKKSGTHFLQMLQMLKTMANLGIVRRSTSDRSMGGSGSWYKWKEVESNCKNLRNIFIARLAKSMMVYYVLKFTFQKTVERLQILR